jgi:hypothetical protein
MLLQTASGWFFRQLISQYGEAAAIQCFRRLAVFADNDEFMQYRENLRSALGTRSLDHSIDRPIWEVAAPGGPPHILLVACGDRARSGVITYVAHF